MNLELRAVTKSYASSTALRGVSTAFREGRHVAIAGPSGSGKSTMLRLLAGLEVPSSGIVLIDGSPVSKPNEIVVAPHRRRIAMVFQDLALWPNLSVLHNVLLGLSGAGLSRKNARDRALESLALCGAAELINRKPGQLSGGEQQRTALARALAVRPEFLLLDEPFSSLDLMAKAALLADIRSLSAQHRITLILVTHDPIDAVTLCSSLVVMEQGEIKEDGTIAELMRMPSRSPFFEAFVRRCQSVESISPTPG